MSWLRNWAIASSLTAEVLGATEYAKPFLQEKQEMPDFFRLYILIYSVSSKVPVKTEVYADEVCASWGSVGGMSRWWGGLETAEWPNLEGVVVSGAESSWRLITLSVLWKSVLDPVVFNFSFNYFDDETERALRKLAETQNWEKGDLGRPEKWADRNFVMFQRETEVLHLGRINPATCWGPHSWKAAPQRRTWVSWQIQVDREPEMVSWSEESQQLPEPHSEDCTSRLREVMIPVYSAWWGHPCPFLGSPLQHLPRGAPKVHRHRPGHLWF